MAFWVWDTTVLLHACRADREDVLGQLAGPRTEHLITDVVEAELTSQGGRVPNWLSVRPFDGLDQLRIWAAWQQLIGAGPRDQGEAATLAMTEILGETATAIIDDGDARRVAARLLAVHGSLWVFADAVRRDEAPPWTAAQVSTFCDALLQTGIRWPFGRGGFVRWAAETGLL